MQTSTNRKSFAVAVALLALAPASVGLSQTTAPATQSPPNDDVVKMGAFVVSEMKLFTDQAIEGKTPVSFTEIGKESIIAELGSRDIPLLANSTPSVYATTDSGGAGDARINVRGFNQRNISILINGVPTNDIENGWLYWSNWDGLGDVTSTIQMQRGLSNVTLPTPSIGGTMNIITDPAASRRGGTFKFEVSGYGFRKGTVVLNTGMMQDKYALTVGLVAKEADRTFARGTWTKGLGYYVGGSWKLNKANRLEVYAIGAPQEHGQRRFASNIAAYSTDFARGLGYNDDQINSTASGANAGALRQGPINAGYNYNQNVAPVNPAYDGRQFYWDGTHRRQEGGFISESVNYFHKPQANLNWYSTLSDALKLSTVFYYSGGRGGGSGTLNNGSSSAAFARYANTVPGYGSNINWDATIASNAGSVNATGGAKTAGRSLGILRNSVNNQDQYGIVSKLSYDYSDAIKMTTGVDWRTAEIAHFREVRDLLGGQYYLPTAAQASQFWADGANTQLRLGDQVDYYNTNTVDWLGLFLQSQYDKGPITTFGVYGYSFVEYGYEDHFRRTTVSSNDTFKLNSGRIDGHQVKGGFQYAFSDNLRAYVNAGWVSKVPIFDGAINDIVGQFVKKQQNETFKSAEVGVRFTTADRKFNISASYYHTQWDDRTISVTYESADTITYQYGVSSNYSGLELEGAWKPNKRVRFDLAASYGNWYYTDDVDNVEQYAISTGAQNTAFSGKLYAADLKVGDSPQTQLAASVTAYPARGLSAKLLWRWYDRYWSDYTSESRTLSTDHAQPWQIPAYSIFDLHLSYDLPFKFQSVDTSVFLHVFNLFDKEYISDATDESSFEAVGLNLTSLHSAQRAEVFFGPPITFNAGIHVKF